MPIFSNDEEIVALDQKIQVVILDFDDAKKRIALGLKQLTAHPWEALDQNLKVGDKVKGRVVVMADYGAFVEIAPGVANTIFQKYLRRFPVQPSGVRGQPDRCFQEG